MNIAEKENNQTSPAQLEIHSQQNQPSGHHCFYLLPADL